MMTVEGSLRPIGPDTRPSTDSGWNTGENGNLGGYLTCNALVSVTHELLRGQAVKNDRWERMPLTLTLGECLPKRRIQELLTQCWFNDEVRFL